MPVTSCSSNNTKADFSGHIIITTIIIKRKNDTYYIWTASDHLYYTSFSGKQHLTDHLGLGTLDNIHHFDTCDSPHNVGPLSYKGLHLVKVHLSGILVDQRIEVEVSHMKYCRNQHQPFRTRGHQCSWYPAIIDSFTIYEFSKAKSFCLIFLCET